MLSEKKRSPFCPFHIIWNLVFISSAPIDRNWSNKIKYKWYEQYLFVPKYWARGKKMWCDTVSHRHLMDIKFDYVTFWIVVNRIKCETVNTRSVLVKRNCSKQSIILVYSLIVTLSSLTSLEAPCGFCSIQYFHWNW